METSKSKIFNEMSELSQLSEKSCEYLVAGWDSFDYKEDESEASQQKKGIDTMFKFIKKLFPKAPTIGQMRTELEICGVKMSDKAFATLTHRELKVLLRKARRLWHKVKAVDEFIESREQRVKG